MKKSKLIICVITVVFFSSCFHKNVLEDNADDIEETIIVLDGLNPKLIQQELIFQATSKKSGGGSTHISGYNEFRISSYDANTGKLLNRVKTGNDNDSKSELLGELNGLLWFYTNEKDGFHCRSVNNLEMSLNEEQLRKKDAFKNFEFARPKWYEIKKMYKIDEESESILITNIQGDAYLYNPKQNTVTKAKNEKIAFENDVQFKASHAQYNDSVYFSFTNALKCALQKNSKENNFNLEFISANLLLETNKKVLIKIRQNSENKTGYLPSNSLLLEKQSSFFVHSSENITDTAYTVISKIEYDGINNLKKIWDTKLPGVYFDLYKAREKGAFETVFSKGNPVYNYNWSGIINNQLILVTQLKLISIDLTTGKIIWVNDL